MKKMIAHEYPASGIRAANNTHDNVSDSLQLQRMSPSRRIITSEIGVRKLNFTFRLKFFVLLETKNFQLDRRMLTHTCNASSCSGISGAFYSRMFSLGPLPLAKEAVIPKSPLIWNYGYNAYWLGDV